MTKFADLNALIDETLKNIDRRCEAARNAGGIALEDVENGVKEVPDGWELDHYTYYFLPPNVKLI